MLQNIVLGPDVIDFVSNNGWNPKIETSIVRELNRNLIDDTIFIDKENRLIKLIEDQVNDDMSYSWWEYVFDLQLKIKKVDGIEKPLFKKGVTEADQLEAGIAKKIVSRIWLKSKETLDDRKIYILNLHYGSGPGPITFENYIEGSPKHLLIRATDYDLNKGDYFPFPKIWKPLFENSKIIKIVDPYIVQPDPDCNAVYHINKIISYCHKESEILIETKKLQYRMDKDRFNYGRRNEIDIWKIELEKKFNNVKVRLCNPKNRFIHLDDNYTINLSHGLEKYGKDCKVCEDGLMPFLKIMKK